MSPNPSQQHTISQNDLRRAVDGGVITAEQAEALWRSLGTDGQSGPKPRFDLTHLLWYAGALIVIGAMGLFTSLAFSRWGGGALATTAFLYALLFALLGGVLWRRDLKVPGGLCIAVTVTMAPLFVFGLQHMLGWWSDGDPGGYRDFYHWIKASWLPMEVTTVLAGVIAIALCRFAFLAAPIAVALWFMSMDLVPWFFGEDWSGWEQRAVVSTWFGVAMLVAAWWTDLRARADYAFWLHLFGLLAFWGGLTMTDSDSELSKAFYCLINVGLLALAVFLRRGAYAVFGALGVALYLNHLADEIFRDSLLYPFALSLIGLLILGAGLFFHRKRSAIDQTLNARLPPGLRDLRPTHAR